MGVLTRFSVNKTTIDFMALRPFTALLSLVLVLASVASLLINGLPLGLDFTGGTLIEVGYSQAPSLEDIRVLLAAAGHEGALVQTFGSLNDVLIRLSSSYTPEIGEKVRNLLQSATSEVVDLRRTEFVGAQVGEDLRERGGMGVLVALAMITLYVSFRFQLKFAIGAVVALFHDVIIVLGAFSLFGWDFDLTVLAAILAVIGYSLNDSLVVADRIRENIRRRRQGSMRDLVNLSLNETLSRTLMTSFTTLLVVIALFLFGGSMIHGFATALLVGIAVGTYSSIYVASDLLLWMNLQSEDLVRTPAQVEEDLLP
ncbi:protein translocase subunit SecF [Marinobacterium rhizophilum]|uniref:Protein-export membrane protein SecF n=1 Tax=Marinobacterium rhizophilum TaxID=420402 RepID=A0ABY5HNT7_9GAMM|nr:protein translocase subunit SecF [Marinobacterium rhizophilum]UTW12561.1 protein translocase subunit SecF [Marinobacterium rhizophilum]